MVLFFGTMLALLWVLPLASPCFMKALSNPLAPARRGDAFLPSNALKRFLHSEGNSTITNFMRKGC